MKLMFRVAVAVRHNSSHLHKVRTDQGTMTDIAEAWLFLPMPLINW